MARSTLFLLTAVLLLGACATDTPEQDAGAAHSDVDVAEPQRAARAGASSTAFDEASPDDASPGEGSAELPPAVPVQTADRIIKEGTISVEVEAGGFDRAFAAVIAAARRVGGTVVSSTTRTRDDDRTSGSITVRVPVEAYEDLLVSVGDVGRVLARQITAEDVSTEFVDLQSRLRHLQAQERFYLALMDSAETVNDAIAVQQHLQQVQQQMEQIQGRLQYLEERTAHSTLTVELLEPGTEVAGAPPIGGHRPSLALYWERARDAFVNTVGALLVAALFLAPFVVLAGILLLAWRAVRRRPALPLE